MMLLAPSVFTFQLFNEVALAGHTLRGVNLPASIRHRELATSKIRSGSVLEAERAPITSNDCFKLAGN
jgi:hypothetical protein